MGTGAQTSPTPGGRPPRCRGMLPGMPQFSGLPRAVLVAISNVSGETYREINGTELMAELARMGHEPEPEALSNLLNELKDAGFVWFEAVGGLDPRRLDLIRLAEGGRQEVEAWPKPGAVSAADVEALIRAFEDHADNPEVPEPERRTARAAASYVRDLSVDVAGSILSVWLRSIGIG
jgi:DNA-binding PadR family transcriptional regulator